MVKHKPDCVTELEDVASEDECDCGALAKHLKSVLRLVDEDVRHHLRSDEIAHAIIRKHAVQAVRDALKSS